MFKILYGAVPDSALLTKEQYQEKLKILPVKKPLQNKGKKKTK